MTYTKNTGDDWQRWYSSSRLSMDAQNFNIELDLMSFGEYLDEFIELKLKEKNERENKILVFASNHKNETSKASNKDIFVKLFPFIPEELIDEALSDPVAGTSWLE